MYKWNASDYNQNSFAQQQWAAELIKKLQLQGNETVLDIGCGDGKNTSEIAKLLPKGKIIGIDNSPEMITFAQKLFPSEKYPNIFFKLMDARHLTLMTQFDVVFSNATLHWMSEHEKVLQGISALLKPHGKILLQMGGKGNAAQIFLILDNLIKLPTWARFFRDFTPPYSFYGPEEYHPWLQKTGFLAKRVELIPKDMVQKGTQGLRGWIRTTWMPYLQRIPSHLQLDFLDDLVARYEKQYPPDPQGNLHVPMIRLEVEAIKL